MDLLHGGADVAEVDVGLCIHATSDFRASVSHPAIVGGVARTDFVAVAAAGERNPVREDDLGHYTLALQVGHALLDVPLGGLAEFGVTKSGLARTAFAHAS